MERTKCKNEFQGPLIILPSYYLPGMIKEFLLNQPSDDSCTHPLNNPTFFFCRTTVTDSEQGDFGEHIVTSMTSFALPSMTYEVFEMEVHKGKTPGRQVRYLIEKYLEPNEEHLDQYSGCYIVMGNNSPQEYSAQVLEYSLKILNSLNENLKAVGSEWFFVQPVLLSEIYPADNCCLDN